MEALDLKLLFTQLAYAQIIVCQCLYPFCDFANKSENLESREPLQVNDSKSIKTVDRPYPNYTV